MRTGDGGGQNPLNPVPRAKGRQGSGKLAPHAGADLTAVVPYTKRVPLHFMCMEANSNTSTPGARLGLWTAALSPRLFI